MTHAIFSKHLQALYFWLCGTFCKVLFIKDFVISKAGYWTFKTSGSFSQSYLRNISIVYLLCGSKISFVGQTSFMCVCIVNLQYPA